MRDGVVLDLRYEARDIDQYISNPKKIDEWFAAKTEGLSERLRQYETYRRMLADWFREPEETAMGKVEKFETEVKKKFIDEPGQMKLLIVVDKLLTGFDAPSATYRYIDKQMRDHGLFQAIRRVNRLDGDDKEYGYIVAYKDLLKHIEGAVDDYTGDALDAHAAALVDLPPAAESCAPDFAHYPDLPQWQNTGARLTLLAGTHGGRQALQLTLGANTRLLLLGGEPFAEPVLMWWNFVGWTKATIAQAQAEWEQGEQAEPRSSRFGRVGDGQARRLMPPALPWRVAD